MKRQRLILLLALIFIAVPAVRGQRVATRPGDVDPALERLWLISDLQSLEGKALKLDGSLARALAKAEIAGAAWTLDKAWAEKLLREAYELTLPDEDEQAGLRSRPIGAPPVLPAAAEITRSSVRRRVLEIAGRDTALVEQLIQSGAEHLGPLEQHYSYAGLADMSVQAGDNESAGKYILKAIEAEPTILNGGTIIIDLAARDRKAADEVIIRYLERLRAAPLSTADRSAWRTYLFLRDLISNNTSSYMAFNNRAPDPRYQRIPPPGPAVMKAYVSYVIESLSRLEQREPGSASKFRAFLLSTWQPLQLYAAELSGPFMQLEKLSRRPGEDPALPPQKSAAEDRRVEYEDRVKRALDSSQPDEMTSSFALGRRDFARARKMVDSLSDGESKTRLLEDIDAGEAASLAAEGETPGAESLAEHLRTAISILQVYPLIINKCVELKDSPCAARLVLQAVRQLKRVVDQASLPLALSRLARAVAPADATLAFEVLNDAVSAANSSNSSLETRQGQLGIELGGFKILASVDENQARQAAANLRDPLQQVAALATICRWKAELLTDKLKGNAGRPSKP